MKLYHEYSHRFLDSNILDNYLMGGQAVVTLQSPTGVKHTYLYSKPNSDTFPDDVRFVHALHEETQKLYIGIIELDKFRLTKHSRFLPDTDIVKGAKYIEKLRKDQAFLDKSPMTISHEGTCARCGRKLTTFSSIEIGYGKICKQKVDKYNVGKR